MGNNNQARSELDQVVKSYPNSPEAVLQLASLDVAEGRYKEAEDAFLLLHKARPQDLRALMGLTEAYALQKQFGKASEALEAELAKQPGRLELRNALGNICYRAGEYDLAVKQYQAIIQARPDAADVYVRLGKAYAAKDDVPSAIRTFDKAKELKPNDVDPYLQMALLYERTGQGALARPLYERVLKLQPDHPVAMNNLAYVIAESGGDLDQALALAQRARQKMPDNADVSDTLGWIYIKKNLSDNAVSIYRDLIVKRPQSSTFRYHLAMALYQRGDKPQARKELQSALDRKPSPQEAAKIKELLGRIG
jgi:Flp pilus assembly protein TadD